MKKIFIISFIICSFFIPSYAAEGGGSGSITVTVTEKIPGANCDEGTKKGEITTYKCQVSKGFGSVVSMLGAIIKYFTFIVGLAGVLYLIINGIMYSMGGMDSGMKDEAKKRITATIIGLIILFMSGVILNIIAPWIYK